MSVTRADVDAAARRIAGLVAATPVLRSDALDAWVGTPVWCKAEHRQHAGAFKYRGATNAVRSLPDDVAARGVAAHSSGNHAAALALAAQARGIPCHVVMPSDAPEPKRDRVRAAGATIVECEPTEVARIATLREVLAATGAVEIHPFDDDRVIAGAGTAALELLEAVPDLDVVVAPVGGGGLLSGTAVTAASLGVRILAGEPAGADDAIRSLAAGRVVPQTAPHTIADGLRTSLAERTFAIIAAHVERILPIDEDAILVAQQAVADHLGERVEPSSAVAVAAARDAAALGVVTTGTRVGVILTGGNV